MAVESTIVAAAMIGVRAIMVLILAFWLEIHFSLLFVQMNVDGVQFRNLNQKELQGTRLTPGQE